MISLAEGFGFNTNLLETNILNLAVVLPLVFSLGKDTLTKILDLRREKILESLRNADDRFKQAQLKLDAAKSELAGASETVKEIWRERDKTIAAIRLDETRRYEELYHYYDNLEKETLRIEEEKYVNSVRDEIISKGFAMFREDAAKVLDPYRYANAPMLLAASEIFEALHARPGFTELEESKMATVLSEKEILMLQLECLAVPLDQESLPRDQESLFKCSPEITAILARARELGEISFLDTKIGIGESLMGDVYEDFYRRYELQYEWHHKRISEGIFLLNRDVPVLFDNMNRI
jgi:F-type H+-transporting ATPase subunit b